MTPKPRPRASEDSALNEDIRYLGRILGDTIREQAGTETFDLVERIRHAAIRYRRDHDATSLEELEKTLRSLNQPAATNVVRAFSYFHLLANTAEDLHRNGTVPTPDGAAEGSVALALERARKARLPTRKLVAFFERARIEPVLTAHPTEVQRKSILDRHQAITARLAARRSLQDQDPGLRRDVLILWKTSELRSVKPTVADEIENGLAYFRSTFLDVLPALYAAIEDEIGSRALLPPFLRVASWIGGDRDGNPHVTHDVTAHAVNRQASVALGHYMAEVHALGAELSLSSRYTAISSELAALADRASDRGASRNEELFRRALVGIYARLVATARALEIDVDPMAGRPAAAAPAYGTPAALRADLDVIDTALREADASRLAGGRLRALRRAVDVFGFHLASLDLRQASDVHGRVVAEILTRATGRRGYDELPEPERQSLLLRELSTARPLVSPHLRYSDEAAEVLATVDTAARLHARFGPEVVSSYVISMTAAPSDVLEVALLLKEAGLYVPGEEPRAALTIVPLFETISDLRGCGGIMD